MDAERVKSLATTALCGFEDLQLEDAMEGAMWDLTAILENVADDPASIALVTRVKALLGAEGLFAKRKTADAA